MARENLTMVGLLIFFVLCYVFSKAFRRQLEADRWPEH